MMEGLWIILSVLQWIIQYAALIFLAIGFFIFNAYPASPEDLSELKLFMFGPLDV